MATLIANFSLDSGKDKDIIRWLDGQSNRSAAIRAAIRTHIAAKEGVTLAEVLAEIKGLPARFSMVASTPDEPLTEGEEPQAAAANLDGLLDRLGNGDLD